MLFSSFRKQTVVTLWTVLCHGTDINDRNFTKGVLRQVVSFPTHRSKRPPLAIGCLSNHCSLTIALHELTVSRLAEL